MGTLTIRNVDEVTHERLRQRAARQGSSVEAEVRRILAEAVDTPRHNFLLELHDHVGADGIDLPLPSRDHPSRPVDLP